LTVAQLLALHLRGAEVVGDFQKVSVEHLDFLRVHGLRVVHLLPQLLQHLKTNRNKAK
jgi:hypothetical protein